MSYRDSAKSIVTLDYSILLGVPLPAISAFLPEANNR
jgi:hypothetical protein